MTKRVRCCLTCVRQKRWGGLGADMWTILDDVLKGEYNTWRQWRSWGRNIHPPGIGGLQVIEWWPSHCDVGFYCIKCRIRYGECRREQTLSRGRNYFKWIQHTTSIHATSFLVSAWFIVTNITDTFLDVILLKYCCNVRMNDFPQDKYCSRPHSP